MIEFLSNIDTQLLLLLNSLHTPAFDGFMYHVSDRFVWAPLYAIILTMLIHRFGLRAAILCLLGTILAVTIADQTCATLIRPFMERLRPANPDNPISPLVHIVNGYRGGPYGMPSCHAANTFAVATFLTLVFRHRRLISISLFTWALLNCYSRIYLGVHYPGDLLVGACIGVMAGLISFSALINLKHIVHSAEIKTLRESIHLSLGLHTSSISISAAAVICATGLLTTTVLMLNSLISQVG